MTANQEPVLILGAGLAGLAAGHALARAGIGTRVIEKDLEVGGLAKTVVRGSFRFDLGGHRFFTPDRGLQDLVRALLGEELLTVARKSQILLRNRYIDYPLKPLNGLRGLGPSTVLRVILEWAFNKAQAPFGSDEAVSLEDWVVKHFGRTLFHIYFKEYSEKVWGIPAHRISRDWVAERIQGLSLAGAIGNAFLRRSGGTIRTLTDRFLYPSRGIGRIAHRLREEIQRENHILCGAEVSRLHHENSRLKAATFRAGSHVSTVEGESFISTIPITDLVWMLDPKPPSEVLRAAGSLKFRDLVVVAVMLDRERATDQSWLYFPEPGISFGRIHEPTNWSPQMAPAGATLLVAEQFCFRGDETWKAGDQELADRTIARLNSLGLVRRGEVLDSAVRRVPKAYPLFEVGYQDHCRTVREYLQSFPNLFLAGRGGTFRYQNMDHAMASGMEAAQRIMGARLAGLDPNELEASLEGRIA